MAQTAEKLEFPQLQFIMVVDISFMLQRLIPLVLVDRVDKLVDAPFLQVQISCRGAEAVSDGPDFASDHRVSPGA